MGQSGGMLLGFRDETFEVGVWRNGSFFISVDVYHRNIGVKWCFILVYGPVDHVRTGEFLEELVSVVPSCSLLVVVGGNFNLIRRASDKSNNNVNWPRVCQFNDVIMALSLRELHRAGARFTWIMGSKGLRENLVSSSRLGGSEWRVSKSFTRGANLEKEKRAAREDLLWRVQELDRFADSQGLDEEGWALRYHLEDHIVHRERWEIFSWEPSNMPGIPRELAEHALNVDPKAKHVQQMMRRFSEPKRKAIGEEVNRLRMAGFIRELKEAEWITNPVMVPKKDTTALRMCIDYTSLNKHFPKDHFPLPRIDQIVDSTAGCDRLSFLDAYSGYNQIKLKKEDQEFTAFITPHDVYCYNVMTFGLKNAGATYQRCMQACLGEHMGRNIKVYIDDIVIKTRHATTLIDDLRETFDNLDRYKIKLNPKKCFFGVPGGQILGYFISARGIEANPLKIKAILDMEPPKNLHQVQQLAGRLAALSRFIA
ncbi:hypothetical protein QYE76_000806 [Lolium multiflorum]|uniref:Reverse transcriptase domain-containing protein n=1 Tax=Lolium multiflorum TaxID=4521 RepID=A0AAD8VZ30_LOLMU|nr:hypothetical protein QYE76_000806 [Lolium multiflorum]